MKIQLTAFLCLSLISANAHEAYVRVNNGVPQIHLDGQPVRPRWTYNRTQQGIFGDRNKVPRVSSYLMNEPVRRQFLFTAEQDTNADVTVHFKLYEYNISKPVLNWWIDDFAFEDLTDGRFLIPTETFDDEKNNPFSFFPKDDADYQVSRVANGGRDDSPALKITWRNIKAMENEGLPYHTYTIPRRMQLKAGHDYRISFWSNADATARLDISVRALPDYHICLADKYDVMQETLLLAKDAGIDFVTTMIECPWPRPGEAADWVVTDTTLDHILAVMPNAKIVPRFKVLAPSWWREEHPDDMFGADPNANFKYNHAVESFCSELWRREAKERIRALIEHVEEKYGANIVGYHPCPSHEEEWFWPGAIGLPDRSGYGPREIAAWRQWLKRKYGTDNALQLAWAQPTVTLETAEVPPPKRYAECDADGIFLSTATSRDIIDHNEFLSDMMSDVLLEFAHTVREVCGKKRLVLAFYGYCLETAPSYHQPGVGHDCLKKVLASPDVDILCSPISYWERLEGGVGPVMSTVESAAKAGKLWFMEDDSRTHLAISGTLSGLGNDAFIKMRWGAQHVLLRNLGEQLVRNMGCWWMDLGSLRWFEDPALWEMMRAIERADRIKLEHPMPFRPAVAAFCDERAYNYSTAAVFVPADKTTGKAEHFIRHPAPTHAPLMSVSRLTLGHLGTSFGHYLLTDMLEQDMPEVKLAIYMNPWVLTAKERTLLKQRSANRFALWCFAPGYVDPVAGLHAEQVQELTGFHVTPVHETYQQVKSTDEGRAAGLPPEWAVDGAVSMVMAVTEQPGDLVLACWSDGKAAIVQRGNAIYNATTSLSWELLRHAAKAAGVHLYTDQECVFYTDGHFAVLHGIREETVTVTLPAKANEIYDATNMLLIAEHTDKVVIPLKFGETRILYWK